MSKPTRQLDDEIDVDSGYFVLSLLVLASLAGIIFLFPALVSHFGPVVGTIVIVVIGAPVFLTLRAVLNRNKKVAERLRQEQEGHRQRLEEERRRENRWQEEYRQWLKEERRREEQERAEQIEALLERDAFRESVHYMKGVEFETFIASIFDKKGYHVQTTPTTGDQGVDLLLTIGDRKVAVQLKRYTAPVGNAAVQAVVAGMFHYRAKEAWVITTSSFTKSAVELAKSNRVRLVDGRELEDWLNDLRDEA